MSTLRQLHFDNFDELLADVERLRLRGYEKSGQWELPTMLDHLARAANVLLGAPGPRVPWIAQPIARFVIRRMVRKRKYPTMQFKAPKEFQPAPDATIESAYPAFVEAMRRVREANGPIVKTIPFGPLNVETVRGLTLLHAAHHLSHLVSKH